MAVMQDVNGKELQITINGENVDILFNQDGEETLDPTDAIEYSCDYGFYTINPDDEVCVKLNPMNYMDEE